MRLPISLLVLVALSQALSIPPVVEIPVSESSPSKSSPAKSPVANSSAAKQKDDSETSKRELNEGNFGERNKEIVSKYEVTGSTPKIEYANLQDMISEQSPAHQIFGLRLTNPPIAKISDVLSEHGPSFEAALAKHLYSPVSVYQTRLSSPTSFEVPTPAASQSPYSNHEQKPQEGPLKAVALPSPAIPVNTVYQPRLQFEAYPQHLDLNLPQEIFRLSQLPKKVMSSLFPISDQLGPFRYPGQEVRSQILHQNGLYQIVPVRTDFGFDNQKGNYDKNYPKQENHEQLKAGQPKLQTDIPVPKQGYHAHPNGAISFASFSHNLPVNTQYKTGPQAQQAQLQSQAIPVQLPPQIQPKVMLQPQEQKFSPVKQRFLIPSMFERLIQDLQDLQKYEPDYRQQPQTIPFKQQIQNQPRMLNALQQHLLFQHPRQLPNPQLIQLQHLPAFKRLPESLLQQTSRSPVISERLPRPFSYKDQRTQNLESFGLASEPASTQLTPLPPLKPNYSKYVKPLEPQLHTTPVFLPTPLQPLSTSTPTLQPMSDQLISSTTIQPKVKGQGDPNEQSIQKETQPLSQTSQPLTPQITHQSQPTVQPAPIQSTTYLPFVTREPQSIYFQYSTPRPVYQTTTRPSSPRHDVVIQQQEIQELFFEPSPHPPSIRHYVNQIAEQEQEVHLLGTQPHHQLFEQLQPLQFQQEMPDINSQPYQLKARQLKSPQKQDSSQQGEPLQYLIQQHSHPLQHFQPKLLQSQQSELEQLQQQQLVFQTQQHGSEQAQQQASEQSQQQVSEQAQQQASEQAQQQQQASEQAKPQQQASEHAQHQQHGSEQAQPPQYQQHLDTNNQIQISTLKPSQDAEKQIETVEIQQQPESQPQLQQQSNIQPTTGKPKEQPDHLSEPTPNVEQPYVGPLLTSSDLPQIYAHQQQLVSQPEYSPLLGVPPYSDVQYFGKFAETLFGNHHQ